MPHQNTTSSKATSQNAATDPAMPNDQAREQNREEHAEPRSYAAPDVADATLASPAAGEVADYMDEGDAIGDTATGEGGVQQGRNHTTRPLRTEAQRGQGPKTRTANREQLKGD
ncbi:MAG TPA: hypothetical protein VG407_02335 [Caulobacteraceae bacterium]|jgi:hypothetical protein|nr:hypothetical protein [Caulobacteraceae bacterium]